MEIVNVSFGGGMSMQLTPVVCGLACPISTVVEGNTFTITFTTNTPSAYPYTITGVSSADIGNASLTGTFTANGETRTYTVTDDNITEGRENFLMTLDNGQAGALIGIDDPYYTLTSNVSSVNEGNAFTITFVTNAVHALPFGYTITGVSNVDFNGAPSLTGNFTSNGQVLTYTANVDFMTEGTEYFLISLNNGKANANVIINDTSTTIPGQAEYTVAGTYSWIAPTGISNVSVVVVGAGGSGGAVYQPGEPGGGGGGALAWGNATVTPGQSYTVVVGAGGGPPPVSYYQPGVAGGYSSFGANVIFAAGGGRSIGYTAYGGNVIVGQGGGYGGNSTGSYSTLAGGAGAGGYSGNGGNGSTGAGTSGSGGGGGAGGTSRDAAAGGGGVGIYGAGSSGAGGAANYYGPAVGGGGGSAGQNAANVNDGSNASEGGRFGGGGGTGRIGSGKYSANGAVGAVRIIWGTNRYYPSTNTANV